MPRAAVVVLLVLAMLWQTVAMARVGSSVNVLADPAHAALHWHETDHHHHDDGTYHLPQPSEAADPADAAKHLLADPVSSATALLMAQAPGLPALGALRPVVVAPDPWPDQPLDGLLRPPRARA